MSERLTDVCHIMNSDDDQPIVMTLSAGIRRASSLVICVDTENYENHRLDSSIGAVVGREDFMKLARRHSLNPDEVPQFIAECMAEWGELVNPAFTDVMDCFKEITECLLDEGCRFRIVRSSRRHGLRDF